MIFTMLFPFLIGKVHTIKRYEKDLYVINKQFPFLIGKVLTRPAAKQGKGRGL